MTMSLAEVGSLTARRGFANEDFVRDEFNNWRISKLAQDWLVAMHYNLNEIEYVRAEKLHGYKTDVQVQVMVMIKLKHLTDIQNIQVKLVSNKSAGFNQIDKRWVDKYIELWDIPSNVAKILKHYTGELPPYRNDTRDKRRMFMDEMTTQEQYELLGFLKCNRILIVSDIIKGRGEFHAEWILVILNTGQEFEWSLEPINVAMNYFGNGDIIITKNGNIRIGHITMQRKGGDGGRSTANMLQFKANPLELLKLKQ